MARYIDADKLEKEIDNAQNSLQTNDDKLWDLNKPYFKGLCWARRLLIDQPTADVVEVVRCKGCKYNVANQEADPLDSTDYSGDDIVCSYFVTDGLQDRDYCSHGERINKDG